MSHRTPPSPAPDSAPDRLMQTLLDLLAQVPPPRTAPVPDAPAQVAALVRRTAAKTSLTAGALALPPGLLGWLTVLPEMVAVWRQQAQMVADIAALHGHVPPTQAQMLVCLFRHSAGGAVRDLVARVGDRWVVLEAGSAVMQRAVRAVSLRLARRGAGRGLGRWVPLAGAAGVAAYVWADTREVAATAERLFSPAAG